MVERVLKIDISKIHAQTWHWLCKMITQVVNESTSGGASHLMKSIEETQQSGRPGRHGDAGNRVAFLIIKMVHLLLADHSRLNAAPLVGWILLWFKRRGTARLHGWGEPSNLTSSLTEHWWYDSLPKRTRNVARWSPQHITEPARVSGLCERGAFRRRSSVTPAKSLTDETLSVMRLCGWSYIPRLVSEGLMNSRGQEGWDIKLCTVQRI